MTVPDPDRQAASGVAQQRRRRANPALVRLKRAYDAATASDGVRILVDRLWPRGLSRERVAADLWLKDAAPSDELRRWFGHEPRRWAAFAAKYRAELRARPDVLQMLSELQRRGTITLVYAARDPRINHAVVLREALGQWRGTAGRVHSGAQ